MQEMVVRIVLGGLIVSAFAMVGEVVKPKSFAGLFGAAPSVALASLGLALTQHGKAYASVEARSMILGAVAFFLYASLTSWLLIRKKWAALPAASLSLLLWVGAALGLWYGLLS
ncbi:MAG: DUF3147 family protein [Candidatus Korobacteraceae bacterium]